VVDGRKSEGEEWKICIDNNQTEGSWRDTNDIRNFQFVNRTFSLYICDFGNRFSSATNAVAAGAVACQTGGEREKTFRFQSGSEMLKIRKNEMQWKNSF
jgi:hypothetical protein